MATTKPLFQMMLKHTRPQGEGPTTFVWTTFLLTSMSSAELTSTLLDYCHLPLATLQSLLKMLTTLSCSPHILSPLSVTLVFLWLTHPHTSSTTPILSQTSSLRSTLPEKYLTLLFFSLTLLALGLSIEPSMVLKQKDLGSLIFQPSHHPRLCLGHLHPYQARCMADLWDCCFIKNHTLSPSPWLYAWQNPNPGPTNHIIFSKKVGEPHRQVDWKPFKFINFLFCWVLKATEQSFPFPLPFHPMTYPKLPYFLYSPTLVPQLTPKQMTLSPIAPQKQKLWGPKGPNFLSSLTWEVGPSATNLTTFLYISEAEVTCYHSHLHC